MAYSYYYIETHPVHRVKKMYSLEQAQQAHKALWLWKSENPGKMFEQWPGFQSNGGEWPIGFMYKFVCDLTKDKLGVRRCSECPHKWIDRETNKALGRWSAWHWCDYPGALMSQYHDALEQGDLDRAKSVAIEISNLTLSAAYAESVVVKVDRPTFDELVDRINDIELATDSVRIGRMEDTISEIRPKVETLEGDVCRIKPKVDLLERATDQMEFMREAKVIANGT